MIRVSFRQSMLAGLLLIVVLLGGASVRSWYLLERFAAQSRANGALALRLSEATPDADRGGWQAGLPLDSGAQACPTRAFPACRPRCPRCRC